MDDQIILRYFLGGNTSRGFHSLYDGFVPVGDTFLWIIKGGPGCGKSSFMKMIGAAAEKAGYSVEYAVCSGDPASLDGVSIPALKIAYVDGTAPHVADPHMAAVDSGYINLGAFYDYDAIAEYRTELTQLYRGCSDAYRKAYSLLAAAGHLQAGWQHSFVTDSEIEAAVKRASGLALREFGRRHKEKGEITYRFMSAHTCHGYTSMIDTAKALCDRFYVFDNRLGLASPVLKQLANKAVETGHDLIVSPDALVPEATEAVLIPSLRLGFLASGSPLADMSGVRRIRLDALIDSERLKAYRGELRRSEKLKDTLLNESYSTLREAKTVHDSIERIFNPNVDFDGVNALIREHIAALGLK